MDGRLGCVHLLAVVENAAVNVGVYTSLESLVLVLLDKYLFDYVVVLFLIFIFLEKPLESFRY